MRLDQLLLKKYPQLSRTFIARAIQQGCVQVNSVLCTKPGKIIAESDVVIADLIKKYVGYAGHKLEHALHSFNIDVHDLICLDAGLSTGGFADCLLQNGAKKVYGVDVGSGQIDSELAQDVRLVVMEQTNLRDVIRLDDDVDFCTLDVSFTSVIPLIVSAEKLLKPSGSTMLVLVKPQFEVGAEFVGDAGIVRDENAQQRACDLVTEALKKVGFTVRGTTEAPRKEVKGNREFFLYAIR